MRMIICGLVVVLAGCPALLSTNEIDGVDFRPTDAVLVPIQNENGSTLNDEEFFQVFVMENISCADFRFGRVPLNNEGGFKILNFAVFDGDGISPGNYDIELQPDGAAFAQTAFLASSDTCGDREDRSLVGISGLLEVTAYTPLSSVSFSFESEMSDGDSQEPVSGSINGTFCNFDPDQVEEICEGRAGL